MTTLYLSRADLFQENGELTIRVKRTKKFILSDEYDGLSEVDRKDLKEQLKHMEAYLKILGYRVSRACN